MGHSFACTQCCVLSQPALVLLERSITGSPPSFNPKNACTPCAEHHDTSVLIQILKTMCCKQHAQAADGLSALFCLACSAASLRLTRAPLLLHHNRQTCTCTLLYAPSSQAKQAAQCSLQHTSTNSRCSHPVTIGSASSAAGNTDCNACQHLC